MRLLTYNVRSLKQDRSAVVEIVRAHEPDVVALQEPPKWWRGGARLRALAADCGLVVVVAGGLLGARTCAVLARPGLARGASGARALRLPLRVGRREHWFPTLRGAAVVALDPPGAAGPVVVVSAHLSLDPEERARHLRTIEAAVAGAAWGRRTDWDRVVVAGDLNEPPGGPAWRSLAGRGLRDLGLADDRPTFSTTDPRRRLDVVLAGAGLDGVARRCDDPRAAAASDHFPVVVDLVDAAGHEAGA